MKKKYMTSFTKLSPVLSICPCNLTRSKCESCLPLGPVPFPQALERKDLGREQFVLSGHSHLEQPAHVREERASKTRCSERGRFLSILRQDREEIKWFWSPSVPTAN